MQYAYSLWDLSKKDWGWNLYNNSRPDIIQKGEHKMRLKSSGAEIGISAP